MQISPIFQLAIVLVLAGTLIEAVALHRVKRGSLTDEAERLLKDGHNVNPNDVGALIDLVERNSAQECLSRVICELSQNGRSHQDAGSKFAKSLLKFQQSKHPKVKQYLEAMTFGTRAKSQAQCKNNYSKCNHSTSEVISVGNRLLKS